MKNTQPEEIKVYEPGADAEEPSWEEIETEICTEIDEAIKFQRESIVPKRTENWDRYYGKPFGNEVKGKSQYMSRDLLETVEWILPNLLNLFSGADHKVKLKVFPEQDSGFTPEQLGKALMDHIYEDLYTDDSAGYFTILYTWFKDALVSGSAYVKLFWEVDYTLEEFNEILDKEQYQEFASYPEVSIKSEQLLSDGSVAVKSSIERISKDDLVCDNIPHWEFIFEEHTRSMNDDTGKGFATIVTMDYLRRINKAFTDEDGTPFFFNLETVEAVTGESTSDIDIDTERKNYYNYQTLNDYVGKDKTGAKKRVQLVEWNTKLDVNGDGFLEDVKVWKANGVMIRWELNDLHFIPCSKLSPILDCYKFQGIAYADLLVELQELKSMLIRKILDNFDLTNKGRWFLKPNAPLDVAKFLDGIPGDVHRLNPDHIKNIAPAGFDRSNLSLLEYVDSIKENRTGSTKYNQGTDASTLNQTAHGIQTIMSASMKRIEMIGTLFAENGLKDFFKKAALLTQLNLSEPFTAKIMGTEVEITPDMIQGRIVAFAELGQEAQASQAESQKLLQMSAVLFDLNQKFPGIVPPEKAHNVAAKYVEVMGYNSDLYISSAEDFQQAQEQTQEMQSQMQEMQQMLEMAKLQIEQEGVNIDKVSAIGALVVAQEELKTKLMIEKAKLRQREGESLRNNHIDITKEVNLMQKNLFSRQDNMALKLLT